MRRIAFIAVLIASPVVFAKGVDIDKVNGSIRTDAGTQYGEPDHDNPRVAVNAWLFDDFDLDVVPVEVIDGRNLW